MHALLDMCHTAFYCNTWKSCLLRMLRDFYNNTFLCKVKSSRNILASQVMPSILYLKYLDLLWQLPVILYSHYGLFFLIHKFIICTPSCLRIMPQPVKIMLFILCFGGFHAISLHPFSMFFTIDSELISQDTDCKIVIIKYLKLKLQTTQTSHLKNTQT